MSYRIGIVLNFKWAEKKKDELLNINSTKKPWLKGARKDLTITRESKNCVPVDVALGLYIETHYPNITIDYIKPGEISVARFNQNDIIFLMQYDLLEAFHLDKNNFEVFKKTLEVCTNVYPTYIYQKFINNKCTYYKYLEDKGLPVAPTLCLSDYDNYQKDPEKYIENFKVPWKSFIIKPIYGQESFGFCKFLEGDNVKIKLKVYLKKFFPKYKSLIVQEYIPGFDKNNLEARLYYIGGKYLFCMTTSGLTHTTTMRETRPIQEGGTFRITDSDWKFIRELGDKVLVNLPKINGENSIITRIDIGKGLPGVTGGFFVNEVEFVPAFFIEKHNEPVINLIGDNLVKLLK